ncbi:Uncharacterized protein TCM_032780 [Theobroma cacao]|uniref:Uncharacterized protein n=1 Tax=Theobroma cacao TaxID=3641 RepID=A0A061FB17_THECC|nr:Uncharacterized protein TCM_032780 [Theobroma cacao]
MYPSAHLSTADRLSQSIITIVVNHITRSYTDQSIYIEWWNEYNELTRVSNKACLGLGGFSRKYRTSVAIEEMSLRVLSF